MMHNIIRTDHSKSTIIIRFMVGAVFVSEGIQKFMYPSVRGTGRFEKIGLPLPEILGPLVGSFEIFCGGLILLGLFTWLASIQLIIIMIIAIASNIIELLTDDGICVIFHAI